VDTIVLILPVHRLPTQSVKLPKLNAGGFNERFFGGKGEK